MKKFLLPFSHYIKKPHQSKKWKNFVYKSTCISQYFTTFFTIISLIHAIYKTAENKILDIQFTTTVIWYFAPFILYFFMIYMLPIIFTTVIVILLFQLFK